MATGMPRKRMRIGQWRRAICLHARAKRDIVDAAAGQVGATRASRQTSPPSRTEQRSDELCCSRLMTMLRPLLALVLCAWLVSQSARADEASAARGRAAEHFDAGVRAFQAGVHEQAARAFLRADDSAPSVVALRNALSAAQRAAAPLLVWQAATRLLAHDDLVASERAAAERARAEAESGSALLELRCDVSDCAPLLDGEAVQPGERRVLPGAHRVTWDTRTIDVECVAGQRCLAAFAAEAPAPPGVAAPTPAQTVPPSDEQPRRSRRQRAALGTFIGLGASALMFGGLTVWSGLQALDARDLHESDPAAYEPSEVKRLARRTDVLLGSGIALAAGAAATALWWVDWNPRHRTQLVLLPEGGAALRSSGRF